MKALKIITGVMAAAGFCWLAGLIGTDDFYTMELHAQHMISMKDYIIGVALMIPFPIVKTLDDNFIVTIDRKDWM